MDVAEGGAQALRVVPAHPLNDGAFDLVSVSPGPLVLDQLGLERTVESLGHRVDAPIAVSYGSDRRGRAGLNEPFTVLAGRVMNPADVFHQLFVALSPSRLRTSAACVVYRDRKVQFPAYGPDPEVAAEVVDHRVGLVRGWSSSFAKNTEAAFRISLTRRNSVISARS
ncbi:hypothetical protein [Streptomyces sp. NPDC003483]